MVYYIHYLRGKVDKDSEITHPHGARGWLRSGAS
jgi:hypothetical protein